MCLVLVGKGIELDTSRSPVRTLPVAPLWCDLGFCSRTVVAIKVRRTPAFFLLSTIIVKHTHNLRLRWDNAESTQD